MNGSQPGRGCYGGRGFGAGSGRQQAGIVRGAEVVAGGQKR